MRSVPGALSGTPARGCTKGAKQRGVRVCEFACRALLLLSSGSNFQQVCLLPPPVAYSPVLTPPCGFVRPPFLFISLSRTLELRDSLTKTEIAKMAQPSNPQEMEVRAARHPSHRHTLVSGRCAGAGLLVDGVVSSSAVELCLKTWRTVSGPALPIHKPLPTPPSPSEAGTRIPPRESIACPFDCPREHSDPGETAAGAVGRRASEDRTHTACVRTATLHPLPPLTPTTYVRPGRAVYVSVA